MALDLSLKIDRIDADISVKEFRERYYKPQIPVLIKGLANKQPAGEKWSIDFFKETMGHHEVELFDNRNKEHEKTTALNGDVKMPLKDYLEIIEKDEYTPLRMFVYDMFKLNPALRDDFRCPDLVKGKLGKLGFFFMGGKDTEVRLHFDVDYNSVLLTQFYGSKRIVLVAPEYHDLMYKLPFNTHSNVDLDNPDYDKHPGLQYVKGYDFIQEEGDSLFMPSGYWHYNTYLEGGIAVSYRKMTENPSLFIKSILSLGVFLPMDKVINKVFGDRWFNWKTKVSIQRANKAIAKCKMENPSPPQNNEKRTTIKKAS